MIGGKGSDYLEGSHRNNLLLGGNGDDHLVGGAGDDTVNGGAGNDVLQANASPDGKDLLAGDAGVDTVDYSVRTEPINVDSDGQADDGSDFDENGATDEGDNVTSAETIIGGSNDDFLHYQGVVTGPLTFVGNGGDDTLVGGPANDSFPAGAGSDGNDDVAGAGGIDTADYSKRIKRVLVSLDGADNDGTDANGDGTAEEHDDIQTTVENVTGGAGNDVLRGSTAANLLSGLGGPDTLSGGAGNDRLDGGSGNDVANGGDNDDVLVARSAPDGQDDLVGGPGTDLADYSLRTARVFVDLDDNWDDGAPGENDRVRKTVEKVTSGSGNDLLVGLAGVNNVLVSGAGDDEIRSKDGGPDTVNCGTGADRASTDTTDSVAGCETVTH